MAAPIIRFKKDDGSDYPAWGKYTVSDAFSKIRNKNKDCLNDNVITNSAEFGLVKQRDFFDKDIANEGNTANYTIIQQGDFVYNPRKSSFAPMGPFNRYNLPDDGIVSPLYICLKPKDVLDADFLLWYFQTNKWYRYISDNGAQNGARHDRVGMNDAIMMGIPIAAPCREEQQKIADFLSDVDELINASEEEITNLETQKKAAMKKIFSQEVRFKKPDGSEFPKWEEKPLGEMCYLRGRIGFRGYTREDLVEKGNGAISLSPTNIVDGYVNYENNTYISFLKYEESPEIKVSANDILFTKTGSTVGKIGFVDKMIEPTTINPQIALITAKDCIPYYLFLAMNTEPCKKYVRSITVGGAIPTLSQEALKEMKLSVPSLEEQHLIADFLSSFDEAISAAKEELKKYRELKKGLLQQMFI